MRYSSIVWPGCSKWGGRSSFTLFPRLFSGLSLALCFRHWIMKYSSWKTQKHTWLQPFVSPINSLIPAWRHHLPRCRSSGPQTHGWEKAALGRWPPGPATAAGLRREAHSCSSQTHTADMYREGLRLNTYMRRNADVGLINVSWGRICYVHDTLSSTGFVHLVGTVTVMLEISRTRLMIYNAWNYNIVRRELLRDEQHFDHRRVDQQEFNTSSNLVIN